MRRVPFARKAPPPSRARVKQYTGPTPTARAPARAVQAPARAIRAAPKENPLQHKGYMAAVRLLRCARCRTTTVPRQFCHADEGKGTAIKTDCRRGWPGCPPCHYFVGSSGRMGKAARRSFEARSGAETRATIRAQGKWPAGLPAWPEQTER